MIYYLLILFLLASTNCLQRIPFVNKIDSFFSCYSTQENNLLCYEPILRKLYKSTSLQNSAIYPEFKNITPKNEINETIKTKPDILYFNFIYVQNNQIKVSFFNETFSSYFNYPYTNDKALEHISIDELGNNQFAIFSNYKKGLNHTLKIAQFDITQFDENKFEIKKSYIIESDADRINAHCITTSSNNIVCGLIELF